jgi:hypothetical protein
VFYEKAPPRFHPEDENHFLHVEDEYSRALELTGRQEFGSASPPTIDDLATSLGSAVRDRDPTIRGLFPKNESDLTQENFMRLGNRWRG